MLAAGGAHAVWAAVLAASIFLSFILGYRRGINAAWKPGRAQPAAKTAKYVACFRSAQHVLAVLVVMIWFLSFLLAY